MKTNSVDSALNIEPDQPRHAAQAIPDRHFSPYVEFLFQESLLYTYILLRRNMSARLSLRGLHRLIWVDTLRVSVRIRLRGMLRKTRVDTLRRVHKVGFLVERLKSF